MRTQTIEIYQFDELSENAQEKAMEWYRDGGFDYEWYDHVFEDAKTIGALMGIKIDNIYFTGGFSYQGDGACFEGSYYYKKGSVKAVKDYAPVDKELHRIALELSKLQRPNFYGLTAHIKHTGRYPHEYCTSIDVYNESEIGDYYVNDNTNDALSDLLRDFMRWIYKQLNAEYDYLNSDESVSETIRVNEYEFTTEGLRY